MTPEKRFLSRAKKAGLSLSADDMGRLLEAARWLSTAARASGLSQYGDVEQALIRAMGPALSYFELRCAPRAGDIADFGCGSGAIGATIALLEPNLTVHLVDRAKRAYTTSEVLVARLRVSNAHVVMSDLKNLSRTYGAVVFRALAPAPEAIDLALPHLACGGVICAFHQGGDPGFEQPPDCVRIVQQIDTIVPKLVLTCYRR